MFILISYGIGIYFAVNASYSKPAYCYRNQDGTISLFYARVALGDSVLLQAGNNKLRLPPEKPNKNNFAVNRYDSVNGGNQMYILYENSRAYPSYLITFKN